MSITKNLWIGCLESDQEFINKSKKGYSLASAQVSQSNLITGLEDVSGITFDSINGSVLPPYPSYKDLDIKEVSWERNNSSFNISVGYKNIKYINRVNCQKSMVAATRTWVKNNYSGEELNVFIYSMRSAPLAAACEVKKLVPSAKLYLIITDMPQYMDLSEPIAKKMLKKIDYIQIKRMLKKIDKYILYATKMADSLKLPDNKWILMEGSHDTEYVNPIELQSIKKNRAIMYSGSLDLKYGIKMLLDAFMQIDDKSIELWLSGAGNAEDYIKKCMSIDKRIKYFGFLPSRKDVINKQHEASFLINMRLPSEEASSYCFPSKLFEYIATGTPVISFKLEGIPREYFKYLITIPEENEASLAKVIEDCFNSNNDEHVMKAVEGKDFIKTYKNKYSQSKRIWNYVNNK